jgi:BRO family, N-terminal domain
MKSALTSGVILSRENAMNDIIPHVFENNLVRSMMRADQPWFVGSDVARSLGYRDANSALRGLDEDEKDTHNVSTLGGSQDVIIVSEPGVFQLIFTSRRPEAKRFKRWLAHDVLPNLRRGQVQPAAYDPHPITGEAVPVLTAKLALVREARHLFGHDRARSLWAEVGLPLPEMAPDGGQEEARACLEHILVQPVGDTGLWLRQTLELALDDHAEAESACAAFGIRVNHDLDGFTVANRHPLIIERFRLSDWDHGRHVRVLRRLKGAMPAPKMRYGSIETRGTFLPACYLEELPLL